MIFSGNQSNRFSSSPIFIAMSSALVNNHSVLSKNLKPDLTALGKIIGGGFPVGAICGRKDIMELFSPNC